MDGAQKKFAWITGASFIALVLAMATVLMVLVDRKCMPKRQRLRSKRWRHPRRLMVWAYWGRALHLDLRP